MKIRKLVSLLVICLAIGFTAQAFGQTPNEPVPSLTFEVTSGPSDPNDEILQQALYGRYFAELTVNDSPFFSLASGPHPRTQRFLRYLTTSKTLTSMQRSHIRRFGVGNRVPRGSFRSLFFAQIKSEQIKIQAVTEKDAKALSQLYLNFVMQEYRETTGRWKAQSQSKSRTISVLKKTIAGLEQELPKAKKEFEQLKTEVFYRSPQEAEQAIQELNRILTIAQVDIAGIRFAIETIQEFQIQPRNRPKLDILRSLEQTLVEQSISLKATQARQTTAQELRSQAIRFVELEEYLREGPDKLKQARINLNGSEQSLARINKDVNEQIKPEVIDNKVTLYKVPEPQGN